MQCLNYVNCMLFDYLHASVLYLHLIILQTLLSKVTYDWGMYSESLVVKYISTCWCAFANQHLDMTEKRKIWMNVMYMEASC